jgi:hypothetical protein
MQLIARHFCVTLNVVATATCIALAPVASAQAPGSGGDAAKAGGVVVEAVPQNDPKFGLGEAAQKAADDQARDFMRVRELRQGYSSKNKLFVALGQSELPKSCGQAGYEVSRSIGFGKAMLDAKQSLTEFLGLSIQTELTRQLTSGTPGDSVDPADSPKGIGKVPTTLIEKAKLILDDAVNIELQKRKLPNPKDEAAAAELRAATAKKVIATDSFKEATKAIAQAELSGLQAYRCFESAGAGASKSMIAVVAAYSESSGQLAKSLLTGEPAPKSLKQDSVQEWVDSLSEQELLYTQGAQVRTDEDGEVVLVAFGTLTPARNDPTLNNIARANAKKAAETAARTFVGTMLVMNTEVKRGEEIKVFEEARSDVQNTSSFSQRVKEIADALTMNSDPIRDWRAHHPCEKDGVETYGWVLRFSLSGARAAGELKAALAAIDGWKGGAGPSVQPQAPAPIPAPKKTQQGSSSGAGTEGELDPGSGTRGGAGAPGLR